MSTRDAPSNEINEHPYAVLRNRDFRLYLIGRFIASFGQQMLIVALGWELYERTHSALALGFVGLTQMIPMFAFTLPAGHIAGRLGPFGRQFKNSPASPFVVGR